MLLKKLGALLVAVSLTVSATPAVAVDSSDPTTWTDQALAAQTIFICSSAPNLSKVSKFVQMGLGGVALVGTGVTPALKTQIKNLKKKSLNGVTVAIASDEEGGSVQRLRTAIYKLPSAATMGTWTDFKIRKTAFAYGTRMKNLGVDIAFSPVADLSIAGFFISNARRGFSTKPNVVAKKVVAWSDGLKDANVLPVIKHWPGHGRSVDTHAKPGVLPALSKLIKSDLVPFNYAFEHGITAAMVGHLLVPGLTEKATPTSRSKKAIQLLREQIGPDGLIITDSLSMGGATKGIHTGLAEVAIRSLEAGVDIALVCTAPSNLIPKVAAAVTSGRLPRAFMIEKVKRILAYKRALGIIA